MVPHGPHHTCGNRDPIRLLHSPPQRPSLRKKPGCPNPEPLRDSRAPTCLLRDPSSGGCFSMEEDRSSRTKRRRSRMREACFGPFRASESESADPVASSTLACETEQADRSRISPATPARRLRGALEAEPSDLFAYTKPRPCSSPAQDPPQRGGIPPYARASSVGRVPPSDRTPNTKRVSNEATTGSGSTC